MQNRLMVVLFIIAATVFMGVGIVAALNTGHGTGSELLLAAAAGCVLALPVSFALSRKIGRSLNF